MQRQHPTTTTTPTTRTTDAKYDADMTAAKKALKADQKQNRLGQQPHGVMHCCMRQPSTPLGRKKADKNSNQPPHACTHKLYVHLHSTPLFLLPPQAKRVERNAQQHALSATLHAAAFPPPRTQAMAPQTTMEETPPKATVAYCRPAPHACMRGVQPVT